MQSSVTLSRSFATCSLCVTLLLYLAARLQCSRISSTFGFETAFHGSLKYKKNPIFLMESNIFNIITQYRLKRISSLQSSSSKLLFHTVPTQAAILRRLVMASYYDSTAFRRSGSIKSDEEVIIQGPIEVEGSIKSGSSIKLEGEVSVRDKMDAYGGIEMNGSISCG